MAVTITQSTPFDNMPAYNAQRFAATSNQTGQPSFKFVIKVTVEYNNGGTTKTYTYRQNNPPNSCLEFDAEPSVKNFVQHFIPIGVNGWSRCYNGVLKVTVNIGEEYGAPVVYYAGANDIHYVWNSVVDYLDLPTYTELDYISLLGFFKPLNDFPTDKVDVKSNAFIYLHSGQVDLIKKVNVESTDGSLFNNFDVNNPYFGSANYYDHYVAFNASPASLATLGGAAWIATYGTVYTLRFYATGDVLSYTKEYTYDELCTKAKNYRLNYLNKKGAFDFFNFEMGSFIDYDITKSEVRHQPYQFNSGSNTYTYNKQTPTDFVLVPQYSKKIKITSNWITEAQAIQLLDLLTSTVVYINDEYENMVPVIIEDKQYREKKYFNEKIFNLELTVRFAHVNNRQRGI